MQEVLDALDGFTSTLVGLAERINGYTFDGMSRVTKYIGTLRYFMGDVLWYALSAALWVGCAWVAFVLVKRVLEYRHVAK